MACVLVVEDERMDRIILRNILEFAGHEVHFASDGKEALASCMGRSFDVIVTDIEMPDVDGLQLMVVLKGLFLDARIIVVSGKGADQLAQATGEGAFATFTKPVDPRALLEAVEGAALEGSLAGGGSG